MSKAVKSEFLNLTPFVDLFSVLVIFLIMTAAWSQVSALSSNAEDTASATEPPPVPPPKKVTLSVSLFPDRIEIIEDQENVSVPHISGELDITRLEAQMDVWRQKYPDRKDVVLNTDNKVPYRHMILAFDTLVGKGWGDVGVNTQ